MALRIRYGLGRFTGGAACYFGPDDRLITAGFMHRAFDYASRYDHALKGRAEQRCVWQVRILLDFLRIEAVLRGDNRPRHYAGFAAAAYENGAVGAEAGDLETAVFVGWLDAKRLAQRSVQQPTLVADPAVALKTAD